jgi:hypothetical protein
MAFSTKDFSEILSDLQNRILVEIPQAKLSLHTFFVKIITPISYVLASLWESLNLVYQASNLRYAAGQDLDELAFLHGLERKNALKAQIYMNFEGTNGVVIPSGFVVQNSDSIIENVKAFSTSGATTKKYTASTISFSGTTISDSASGFTFAIGDKILISGSTSNNGVYDITASTSSSLTVSALVTETAGQTVTISKLLLFEAVIGGEGHNVGASTVTVIQTPLVGMTACSNPQAGFGGVDQEEDGKKYEPNKSDSQLAYNETNIIDINTLRGRIISYLRNRYGKTTELGYKQTILSYDGVRSVVFGATSYPNPPAMIRISAYVRMNAGNGIPTGPQITAIQDFVNLPENRNPIDIIDIYSFTGVNLTITYSSLVVESGYDFATVALNVENRLIDFVHSLPVGVTLIAEDLDNVVYQTEGVSNFLRVAPSGDITYTSTQAPITNSSLVTIS